MVYQAVGSMEDAGSISNYKIQPQTVCQRLCATLRLLHKTKNGLSVWSSEDPSVITPDLWVGFLGPATALLLHVNKCQTLLLSSETLTQILGI